MHTGPSDAIAGRTPALLGATAALAVLVVVLLRVFTLPPSFDGAMNLQVAWSIAEGDGYARSYADRAPFPREIQTNGPYVLAAALGYRLFGMGIAQSQLANVLFLLVLAAAAFVLARKVRGRAADGFAAALLLLATPGLLAYGFRGFGEIPGLALVVGGLALYPWADPRPRTRIAAAAIVLGAAVVTKTVMLVCVAPIGLVMVLHAATRAGPLAGRTADLALLAAGFLAPIVAWEAFRLASLGGSEAYRAWWLLEYRSISQEAGIAETPGLAQSMPAKVGQHVAMLAGFLHLPVALAVAWLLLPFGIAAAVPPGARHARWILLATLAATAAYFIWWLGLTPTAKAWHRRIFNGMVLVNIAWILAAAAMASGTASRLRRQAAAATMGLALCFAAAFLVQARVHGAFEAVDSSPIHRAVDVLEALPPGAPVYAAGWSSAPQISLLAGRPLLDINDIPADQLARSTPAYLVVDQEAGLTSQNKRVLALYPSTALVAHDTLPQVYRFDPRTLVAEPADTDLSAPTAFRALDDAQVIGFHGSERHGRWASPDAAMRASLSQEDSIMIDLYVLPAGRYEAGAPPQVAVSLDGCELAPVQTRPGLQRIEFPVAPCSLPPGASTTIRFRSDALLASPITLDERSMSFLAQCIQLGSGDPAAGPAPVSIPIESAACDGDDADPARGPQAASGPPPHALPWSLEDTALSDGALQATRGACGQAPYAAEVHWSLQPAHGAKPEIWIAPAGQPPKLWIAPSQREGAARTGDWLSDATVLYLVDGIGNSVISRLRMDAIACGAPADGQAAPARANDN